MRSRMWVCLVAILVIISCNTGPSSVDYTLNILTNTVGMHQPDGYTLFIDSDRHPIPANGWFYHHVDGRAHTVLLGDVAPNCKVTSLNPWPIGRVDSVYSGNPVLEFSVDCDWNALARVTVRTTGANYDAAQEWWLDASWDWWQPPIRVAVNGSSSFGPILAGEYTISLGVTGNCQVSGDNPRSVMLIHEQEVEAIFEVTCS